MTTRTLSITELRKSLQGCMRADHHRLAGQLKRLERKATPEALARLAERIEASRRRRELRLQNLPAIDYPEELPVSGRRAEIAAALAEHQVILVCGETGSGKTTQLPKILLEAGRGIDGLIGHTQPRRLAARAVAGRIAEELKTELGARVGYKVRFTDRVSPDSYLKVMTDGILLAEIQHDRWLNQYDTIIIDEAHERSLNIDFLLGYLKQLLRRRRDLKLVITSATIDAERIARHFDDAPIVEVSGRSHPVEIRYAPPTSAESDSEDLTQAEAIEAAIDELQREGRGDVLVFLPGEREIHEVSHALRHRRGELDILPLYARLPAAEQQRIFHPGGRTRVILTTNVAETSLTVPGIRYVIDTGLARISRYSWRAKIQRLPIEKISQASANQRAGRCGRTAPGICIRLYDEDDFQQRPAFTDPEILRTNLASVILQMASLRLGDVAAFPFIDKPDDRLIRDGYQLLSELQAVDRKRHLTRIGKQLARLPIDPRLGRMLLAGAQLGCLDEVLIITTALAVQDPRERPRDRQQAADEKHARFTDPKSDFITLLNLWNYMEGQFEALSRSAMQRLCRREFLSFRRWREWHDTHRQLKLALRELKLRAGTQPAEPETIHQALLHGLLDHVGSKDEHQSYLGCRNRKFLIFPGSGLHKKPPKWLMAAEITETTRVYARTVAAIQPQWIERIGAHLLKHHYSEPHWQKRSARVSGFAKLTLYGLVINPKRRINYGSVDPALAREIFIRHALVQGEFETKLDVIRDNRALIDELEELEARTRRRDILVDEHTLYDFYDRIVPAHVHSGVHFTRWYQSLDDPEILRLTREKLTRQDSAPVDADAFPTSWRQQGLTLPLGYHFDPASEDDGVTLNVPLALLPQIDEKRCQWLVPGLLEEKVLALIKSLPKSLRKNFVPAPDFARAACQAMAIHDGDLQETLAATLKRMTGVHVGRDDWGESLPRHLQMRFVVLDERGKPLQSGRNLSVLRERLAGKVRQQKKRHKPRKSIERDDVRDWDFGELPPWVEQKEAGYTIRRYPALQRGGQGVAVKLFDTEEEARQAMPAGLRGLIRHRLKQEIRYLDKNLPDIARLCLQFSTVGSCQQLKDDIYETAIQYSFLDGVAQLPRNGSDFNALVDAGHGQFVDTASNIAELLGEILPLYIDISKSIKGNIPLSQIEACAEIRSQLDALIHPGFLIETPREWLGEIARYLKAITLRLEKLRQQPDGDRMRRVEIAPLVEHIEKLEPHEIASDPRLREYRWLLEELRVSLFAQTLGTRQKVSPKRLDRLWQEIARG